MHPTPLPSPPPDLPAAPPDGPRHPATPWIVHLLGAAVTSVALVVAYGALVVVSFGTSTCAGDPGDPERVRDLQRGLALIGAALTAVPAGWALVARAARCRAWPWLVLAAVLAYVTASIVLTTDEVAYFCIY